MRSYRGSSVFFQRMKKKPRLQAILDQLDDLSEEQLRGVDQPLWIREELIALKQRGGINAEQTAEAIADAMTLKEPPMTLSYAMCRWMRDNQFVGKFGIEVATGDLILLMPLEGIAKIAGHAVKLSPSEFDLLREGSQYLCEATQDQYVRAQVAHLNHKY